MALTINRKDEIKREDFAFIKQKFGQKTNSRALYACVKFTVKYLPVFEAGMENLQMQVNEANEKCFKLVEVFKTIDKPVNKVTGN